VAPLAEKLRDDRRQVLEFARSAPDEYWSRPAPNAAWTNKDLLAHIGRGNDMMVQALLREIIAGKHLDRQLFAVDTDGENRRRVDERRDWPAAKVIAEVEDAGEEMQALLAQLTDEHERYAQDDPPFALAGFMRLIESESHDLEHLAQLQASLESDR
jgi:uncharacterized protein (TIGR03083 family)